ADHFAVTTAKFRNMDIDWNLIEALQKKETSDELDAFSKLDLNQFKDYKEAYHSVMLHLVKAQVRWTNLIMDQGKISRVLVDGGFSKNSIYMNLLAKEYPQVEVYAASMAQATAVGTALAIHEHWNT